MLSVRFEFLLEALGQQAVFPLTRISVPITKNIVPTTHIGHQVYAAPIAINMPNIEVYIGCRMNRYVPVWISSWSALSAGFSTHPMSG